LRKKRKGIFEKGKHLPILIVFVCCLFFASQLGVLEPDFRFQKTSQRIAAQDECLSGDIYVDAFASGNSVMLYVPHAGESVSSVLLEGKGKAGSVTLSTEEQGIFFSKLLVNGQTACSPCDVGRQYEIRETGELEIVLEAGEMGGWEEEEKGFSLFELAFIDKSTRLHVNAPVLILVGGNWKAETNYKIPSSFYGIDAPFHIHRIPAIAGYLSSFRLPWTDYPVLSGILPALAYMAFDISPQYAYKVYEIALFFVPIVLFYLFSTKLPKYRGGAFLFASLIYLFMPSRGFPVGGGADLFVYGMTAHTLATFLSLFSFYFGYGAVAEKKKHGIALSALFFALAFLSNQRILLVLVAGLCVLGALAAVLGRLKRFAVLGIACSALVLWIVVPYLLSVDAAAYSPLGGASISSIEEGLVSFLQIGHALLPLLFFAGLIAAYKQKSMFAAVLAGFGAIVFVFATNPALNTAFPFVDGLRFLPSFFLPAFFLAGIGTSYLFWKVIRKAERVRRKLGLDKDTFAVAFALALLFPFAGLFFGIMEATAGQYSSELGSLEVAAEYASLQKAYEIVGEQRSLFVWRGMVSQYPIPDKGIQRAVIGYFDGTEGILQELDALKAKYVVLGNAGWTFEKDSKAKWEEYCKLKKGGRFSEELYTSAGVLFSAKGKAGSEDIKSENAEIVWEEIGFDSASLSGNCFSKKCSLQIFSKNIPTFAECTGAAGCSVLHDAERGIHTVRGVPEGEFSIQLKPKPHPIQMPLAVLCAAVLVACFYFSHARRD